MARIQMTHELAHAAALDAANAHMRKAGRSVWNSDDSDAARATYHKLIPCPPDVTCELCSPVNERGETFEQAYGREWNQYQKRQNDNI